MSTHNIGFYEEISEIINQLSSNIIKYAPYFFCCSNQDIPFIQASDSFIFDNSSSADEQPIIVPPLHVTQAFLLSHLIFKLHTDFYDI